MKTKTILILMCFLACCMQVNAGTICHDDGTVTFQYKNDQAKEVQVDVQFAGRHPMTRDAETGLWTATLGVKGDVNAPRSCWTLVWVI